MAKNQTTPGARAADPAATPNPSPSDRGNQGTDLPASTPVDGSKPDAPDVDTSAASPAQEPIVPEPFNPNFDDRNGDNTPVGNAPGLADDEDRIEVETTGEFMVQDPYTLDLVPHTGTAKVRNTSFIQTKIAEGQLREPGE